MINTVYVNGVERQLHESINLLTFDRAVTLADLPFRRSRPYIVTVKQPADGPWRLIPGEAIGVYDGMIVNVERKRTKSWWRWW